MTETVLHRIEGWLSPIYEMSPVLLKEWRDEKGYQQKERINGSVECPDCGLWWPLVEDVEEWHTDTGDATEYGWGPGTAECLECKLFIIDTFDGTFCLRP